LLYYSSIQNRKKLKEFADEAKQAGMFNVAFSSYFQLNDYNNCLTILIDSRRFPEAATFARTYIPSKVDEIIELWNKQIEEEDKNNRTTMKIISPINEENKQNLIMSEDLCKEFYSGLNEEKNKLTQDNINNFQEFDFLKESKGGNKINLSEILGTKIEVSKPEEDNTIEKKEEKESEKKEKKKEDEEDDEDGEDDEEGGEEEDV